MVLKEIVVAGGFLLFGYSVYHVSCKLRHRWFPPSGAEEEREEFRQPLFAEENPSIAHCSTEDTPNVPKRSSEDIQSTRKRSKPSSVRQETYDIENPLQDEEWREPTTPGPGSILHLEVISGPSIGLRVSRQAKQLQSSSLTVGRIPRNDLVLYDPEVSGKHALITWNSQVCKWELVDMGSLNGTLLNQSSVAAHHPLQAEVRQRGNPVGLVDGDIVTLGSTSQLLVRVVSVKKGSYLPISSAPFGVGLAADPMTIRKGGRQLCMEDVSLCEWPLRGFQEFGVFCIFDGHGGATAAEAAKSLMPQKLSNILGVEARRKRLLSQCDARDVLQDAFRDTDAALEYEYEGCTATVLLIWWSKGRELFAQCANVGDSACAFSVGDRHIPVTENHRVTSLSERYRLMEMGKQLREGETRLCGMNIARALGDKFLKEQGEGFSSEPFVSDVIKIDPDSSVLAVMASDGLWDVMSPKRAMHFLLEARSGSGNIEPSEGMNCPAQSAQGMAEMLLKKASGFRTKDNTSIIVLDFGCNGKGFVCAV